MTLPYPFGIVAAIPASRARSQGPIGHDVRCLVRQFDGPGDVIVGFAEPPGAIGQRWQLARMRTRVATGRRMQGDEWRAGATRVLQDGEWQWGHAPVLFGNRERFLNPILAGTAEGLLSRLGTEGRDWLDDSCHGAEASFLPS